MQILTAAMKFKKKKKAFSTRPGADCGSEHELLVAKFRFKLKKVGKTTKAFSYDQNQTSYDYTVKVTNRDSRD